MKPNPLVTELVANFPLQIKVLSNSFFGVSLVTTITVTVKTDAILLVHIYLLNSRKWLIQRRGYFNARHEGMEGSASSVYS